MKVVLIMDLDEESRLRKFFWVDARSRASYIYFGNFITFNIIYLTNRFDMPFGLFIGINHHGQFILLGVALLSSENTETFT